MKKSRLESVMAAVRAAYITSGMSLEEVGRRMGVEGTTARQSAWQFLNKTTDPRVSMLLKFADAVGVSVTELLVEPDE